MKTWRLRSGADRRIRTGHPWIFSNELSESPKGHLPGEAIRLEDVKGNFVASGYGNPHSLISFRALSFDSAVEDSTSFDFLHQQLLAAWAQRHQLGYRASFRWCFGEGDFLPGLVIDRYLIEQNGKRAQCIAVQILTAGMDKALQPLDGFFEKLMTRVHSQGLSDYSWNETAVVIRNDVNVRKLEGLEYQNAKVLKEISGMDLSKIDILLHSPVNWKELIPMQTDLIEGQKTGFFLDQAYNIQIVCDLLKARLAGSGPQKIKILDLCSYVGQWSTRLATTLKSLGCEIEVTCVDVSESALKFAALNVSRTGAKVETLKMDVMDDLPRLPDRAYDIVIADPPAFVKAKKDLPTGTHAYLKLNTQAARLTKSGGLLASCSCSGLFKEEDLIQVLSKAMRRDARAARCIAHGGHAPDHPALVNFPEGFYLKMFVHSVM